MRYVITVEVNNRVDADYIYDELAFILSDLDLDFSLLSMETINKDDDTSK